MLRNLLFLFLLLAGIAAAQKPSPEPESLNDLRRQFYSAVEDRAAAEKLHEKLNSKTMSAEIKNDPVLKAYLGATETLLGKHYINPYSKLKHLNNGLEIIAQAITKDPANLEIRFLRFTILHYIPSFLGYNEEREEDLKVIYRELLKKDYNSLSYKIQKGIAEFLIDSGSLTARQQEAVNGLLASR